MHRGRMREVVPVNEPKPRRIVTPWDPSRSATARVGADALPAPTTCPNCGRLVELVGNEKIYGKPYGEWPWAYRCTDDHCDSYVGLHPFTAIPLGTLANKPTRAARKAAKAAFNPLWQGVGTAPAAMTRTEAYAWLSQELGIEPTRCHIGMFEVAQCRAVLMVMAEHARQRPPGRAMTASYGRTEAQPIASCGCDVLPWEHCAHTLKTESTT
jgi:hypothetical protein